jgi:glucose-6-phosphate 1-epimerase
MDICSLNANYAIADQAAIVPGPGGLPVIKVTNCAAEAEISIMGGHVLSYRPKGGDDLLWLSSKSDFAEGQAIRGGIPICWPWFGAHPTDPDLPLHGFVRTMMWELRSICAPTPERCIVVLSIKDSEATRRLWDFPFKLELEVSVGKQLELSLRSYNPGSAPFHISQAIHSYFGVKDIRAIRIHGFDGLSYFNKVDGANNILRQEGPIIVDKEIDAVFLNCSGAAELEDQAGQRRIRIDKEGSNSSVVWNPWIERSKSLSGYKPEAYRNMVCIETCNALDDGRDVAPGSTHALKAIISQL